MLPFGGVSFTFTVTQQVFIELQKKKPAPSQVSCYYTKNHLTGRGKLFRLISNNMNLILILQSSINKDAPTVRRVIHNQLSMKDELYNL